MISDIQVFDEKYGLVNVEGVDYEDSDPSVGLCGGFAGWTCEKVLDEDGEVTDPARKAAIIASIENDDDENCRILQLLTTEYEEADQYDDSLGFDDFPRIPIGDAF